MSGPKKKELMVCDVSRAFFNAPVQHEIYVELCEEAKKTVEDNNICALSFSIGKASPVLFCHPQRSLKCLVYGDDFVVSGEPVDLVRKRVGV